MRRIHHEIRAFALFGIGQLPRQDGIELFAGHVVAAENAFALNFRRSRHHHHRIDALLAAGFEQQGHVDHRDRRAGALGVVEEFLAGGAQHRMHDLLKLLHRRGIVHHARRELGTVDLAVGGRAWKSGLDRRRRFALIDLVNGRIGIVNRNAGLGEKLCGGGFPHPDRAGQPKDQHHYDRHFDSRSYGKQLFAAQKGK